MKNKLLSTVIMGCLAMCCFVGCEIEDDSENQGDDFDERADGGASNGLIGTYYDNIDFTNPKSTRVDATVSFDWGKGSPGSNIGADTFSVRWTGFVKAQYSQTYTFTTLSDDGVRLWVNDKLIVNNWSDHAQTENSGTIALQAGVMYPIKMEFYENLLSAVAKLSWSSSSQAKQIIPSSQLFTGNSSTPSGCAEAKENSTVTLSCPNGQSINAIKFASYGTPTGSCPDYARSACHAASSEDKVKAACLNKQSCSVAANNGVFGDPCVGTYKKLAVTYSCSGGSTDQCPNDPNKTSPGICGCGVADTDTDKDGTADCKDGCKNDPKKTSPGQCGCGVAEGTCGGDVQKTVCDNGIGSQGGYTYEYWKDRGDGCMDLKSGGAFSIEWSNINNLLARKGRRPGSWNQIVTYAADYRPNGNSFLTVYGWTKNPLIEYYIVDSWGSGRPGGSSHMGTVQSDGGTYDIYRTQRVNKPSIEGNATFYQFWSVRTEKRTSGTITVGNHFNAWKNLGMNMGNLYEVSMTVEGWQSSGTANVYSMTMN